MDNTLITSYKTLRRAIGWLGISLPFVLLLGNYCLNTLDVLNNSFLLKADCCKTYLADGFYKSSISHYYYTIVGELFTGLLTAVGLFMICYKGHPLREGEKGFSDNALSKTAGIAAIGVAWFPTSSTQCISDNVRTFLSSETMGYVHYGFAALFFGALAIMSLVNFRRTENKGFGNGEYDAVYKFCGTGILVCMGLVLIYSFLLEDKIAWLDKLYPTFILETAMLACFGISWLVKGKDNLAVMILPKRGND